MKRIKQRQRNQERGAAVVEFAIVAPLLLMLVFGAIELGRAVMVGQVCVNASREACREAVLSNSTSASLTTWLNNYMSNAGIPSAAVTMSLKAQSTAGGAFNTITDVSTVADQMGVQVTVSVNFAQCTWLPTSIVPTRFVNSSSSMSIGTLTASTIMRKET